MKEGKDTIPNLSLQWQET